jgi:hypothetical protein
VGPAAAVLKQFALPPPPKARLLYFFGEDQPMFGLGPPPEQPQWKLETARRVVFAMYAKMIGTTTHANGSQQAPGPSYSAQAERAAHVDTNRTANIRARAAQLLQNING